MKAKVKAKVKAKGVKESKMKKKYCRHCRILVKGDSCPICNGADFTENFQGRLFITDANKSEIAKKLEIKHSGEYAIKVR